MTLAEKLNQIIAEHNVSKAEFARRVGVSVNYVYILTGRSRPGTKRNKKISPSLAKLIALEFSCDEKWLLSDEDNENI